MINGEAHGPMPGTTVCQLHMRHFKDGDVLHVEPWRARAFPVIKDLVVDRGAFDRIIQAGGYISVATGSAPEANLTPVPKPLADRAFDAAQCIGCGACVAQCPNGAAQALHLGQGLAPQPAPAGPARALRPRPLDGRGHGPEGFGYCSNYAECEAVCPKEISIDFIARMNRDYLKAKGKGEMKTPMSGGGAGVRLAAAAKHPAEDPGVFVSALAPRWQGAYRHFWRVWFPETCHQLGEQEKTVASRRKSKPDGLQPDPGPGSARPRRA